MAGFTLIETLVTLSISAIILIVLSAVFSTYFKTYGKKAASTNISELKRSILTGILDDLRFSSSLEVNSNKISFSKANSAIKYEYKSGKVKKTINKYSNYLSEAGQINNLAFAKVKYNLINVVVDPLSAEVAIRNE
ncbi:prepilin-type N-terminal cleavage/methylation domain-containing protein [Candidatus Saganbacteria bacterium]|nr:prepilin-type N-terminal cleavage/methylation domain-containing protein [Candidatus Saganbacteria bacterium]